MLIFSGMELDLLLKKEEEKIRKKNQWNHPSGGERVVVWPASTG